MSGQGDGKQKGRLEIGLKVFGRSSWLLGEDSPTFERCIGYFKMCGCSLRMN